MDRVSRSRIFGDRVRDVSFVPTLRAGNASRHFAKGAAEFPLWSEQIEDFPLWPDRGPMQLIHREVAPST